MCGAPIAEGKPPAALEPLAQKMLGVSLADVAPR